MGVRAATKEAYAPYKAGFEPVRLIGYLTSIVTFVAGVLIQLEVTSVDSDTGWFGLGAAILIASATELQRQKVVPVKKLDAHDIDIEPIYEGGQS